MESKVLDSGWKLLWISGTGWYGGWTQIPPDFNEDTIPDEYIFDPEWNRDRINNAWRKENP